VKRDQLISGVVFVRLATPSPGSEPEVGDEQPAVSYPALFHGTNLSALQRNIWPGSKVARVKLALNHSYGELGADVGRVGVGG
jgi:hypothetical protein